MRSLGFGAMTIQAVGTVGFQRVQFNLKEFDAQRENCCVILSQSVSVLRVIAVSDIACSSL